MKKTKKLSIILIAIITILTLCVNFKVCAGEIPEVTAEGEAVPTDDGVALMKESDNTADDVEKIAGEVSGEQDPNVINEDQNGEEPNVIDEEDIGDYDIHNGDLYIASVENDYEMNQVVDGNVFIAGRNIKISGQINGSLFVCASGKVEFTEDSYVASHIFAFGDKIIMNGKAFDVYSASSRLNVGPEAIIYRDIRATAENIYLSGAVGRDANLFASTIQVPDEEDKLTIMGDFNYEAKSEIQNIDKADITGEVKFKPISESEDTTNVALDYFISAVGTIIFDVVMYLCLLFLAPKFVEKSKEYVSTRGLLAFAIGLAITVIVPILSILLMITGVGVGLGVLALFVYGTLLMLNAFVVAIVANEFISSKLSFKDDKFKKGLLLIPVSLVIWAIRELPIIGTWISIIVFLCGVGIIGLYQFDKRRKEVK